MAWTVTRENTVFGNKRAVLLKCIADAATQNVYTGLSRIDHFVGPSKISMSTASISSFTVAYNSSATGVQSFGVLGCSGFVSGDEFFITVYGPA